MPVRFHQLDIKFVIPSKKELTNFINSYFTKEYNFTLSIDYIFCTKEKILEINRQVLQHNYYTDIITFPLLNNNNKAKAEIYICLDVIMENAKDYKVSWQEEFYRVVFHGILHLVGFNDKTTKEQNAMRKTEDKTIHDFYKMFHMEHNVR